MLPVEPLEPVEVSGLLLYVLILLLLLVDSLRPEQTWRTLETLEPTSSFQSWLSLHVLRKVSLAPQELSLQLSSWLLRRSKLKCSCSSDAAAGAWSGSTLASRPAWPPNTRT